MSAGVMTQDEPLLQSAPHAATGLLAPPQPSAEVAVGRLRDYLELTKPRIAVLELVTVALSAFTARWMFPDIVILAWLLAGTALVAAGASAWNQWLEIGTDLRMGRTADRPLPAGRLTPRQVATFGLVTTVAGVVLLASQVNLLTAAFGFATWILYVVVYTPMKRSTPLNTVVGAVAGAMPVLMGWAAVAGPANLSAASLFMIVFLWQFPHFMAIAWIYRHDYARAGLQMLTVVDPSGRRAGVQAVVAALVLIPISLLPSVIDSAGPLYFAWALLLGSLQLACAVRFMARLDESSARTLLRASVIYLPSLLMMLMLGPYS
ncbi:MAG: protoheme IX farnesyltransferase [Planctomycetales bacterium]|nr:protoheme IX farnesyltransferase [Planctomycetales bacterium]MBN8627697.1 heme o synthase [Planctomycetota bacterium]